MDNVDINKVTENEKTDRKSKITKNNKLILIGVAVVLMFCIVAIVLSSQSTTKRLAKQLDLGQNI